MTDELFQCEESLSPEETWRREMAEIERQWIADAKERQNIFTHETPEMEEPWMAACTIPHRGHKPFKTTDEAMDYIAKWCCAMEDCGALQYAETEIEAIQRLRLPNDLPPLKTIGFDAWKLEKRK